MKKKQTLTIISRKSPLALIQANFVKKKLKELHSDLKIDVHGISTKGDKHLKSSLRKIGGKGVFVKELETALLEKKADVAVHSIKDLPSALPEGLMLGSILERENPFDVLVSKAKRALFELPKKSIIGTSSLRRQTQIHSLRRDFKIRLLRGNVKTRLEKLEQGEFDAIVLAYAGLSRLNLTECIAEIFSIEEMVPAAGQGALGLECRIEDVTIRRLISPLMHKPTEHCIIAEREVNRVLDGNCHVPIGVLARIELKHMTITGFVGALNPKEYLRATVRGLIGQDFALGHELGHKLLAKGAKGNLDAFIGT